LLVFSAVDLPRYLRLLRLVLANLIS
jgi:hypothetical protein